MSRTNVTPPRTLRLKVKREGCVWLDAAAREVNTVWNWANDTSAKAVRRFAGAPKWLTGFDLCHLSAGATEHFDHIGADTIQRINVEYATKRRTAKRAKLRWRKSGGSKRSLGWVPFKAASLKRKGRAIRFCGKTFRVFEAALLEGAKWRDGCFAQDAVGDWWLCLPVAVEATNMPAPRERVGIDLGLKDTVTTSDGDKLEAGRFYRGIEAKLAQAQRRAHRKQAKRLHRKAARQRKDALHQFSRRIVNQYQHIVVGDVSSRRLARTRMAKSVLDAGWATLKTQLQYKGQQAGRCVEIVNEANTTRACSGCGALTGPAGRTGLVVRAWRCPACGAEHDRDINAARNIAKLGSRYPASVCGNESLPDAPPSQTSQSMRGKDQRVRTAA
jgi:IS605 OrfB family transposase